MTFLLRDALVSDVPSIAAIYENAVLNGVASYELDPPSVDEMAERFRSITSRRYPYIAAIDTDRALLGYAYASPFRSRPAYRWMVEDSIYLAPQAQGRGVGKALLAALVERCSALGFRRIVAVIGGGHPASIAVHRSCGFEDGGILKGTGFKQGRWLDTVLMQKSLGEGTDTAPDMEAYPGTLYPG